MFQLTRSGLIGSIDAESLSWEFEELHTFRIRQLIHPDLLTLVCARLARTAWKVKIHGNIGAEVVPEDEMAFSVLQFATNTPAFLEIIRTITGYPAINGYMGRIYRFATSDHYDSWHDDRIAQADLRIVGMSVNLSPVPYQGGIFRIRKNGSEEIIRELPNTEPGDAIFFRISPQLQHVVTPVEGEIPKTAFAGWFGSTSFYPSKG